MTVEYETQNDTPAPQLGLQDLSILVQAVDIAAKAGAFSGNDLEAIGGSRNRVAAFLKASAPAPAPVEEEKEAEESPEA